MVQMWHTRKMGSKWSKCGTRVKLAKKGYKCGTLVKLAWLKGETTFVYITTTHFAAYASRKIRSKDGRRQIDVLLASIDHIR